MQRICKINVQCDVRKCRLVSLKPVRELSVVIGAWIGVRFIGEPGGRVRLVAAALVATGILVIVLGS